jgi:hypothetical protein
LPKLNILFGASPTITKVDPNAIDFMRTGFSGILVLGIASATIRSSCGTKKQKKG